MRSTNIMIIMKLQNKSYIFLLLFFFASCVAKKSTIEYKERIIKDTIYKNVKETIVERFTDTLTVEKPCDSLGNLKPFIRSVSTPQGSVKIVGLNDVITAEIDLDGYKKIWEKEFKSNYIKSTDTKEVEVVKYKYPIWIILTLIISILINILLIKGSIF